MANPKDRSEGTREAQVTLPPEKARQGRQGLPVLLILLVALALTMVVWGLVEIYGAYITPSPQDQVGNPATVPSGGTQVDGTQAPPPTAGNGE